MHDDDATLLGQFVRERRDAALAELVRRHVDLVFSAALRQTRGNSALAQDVTQEVFVLLATKARSIRDGEALAGWLLVATRFVALNALRSESRRRRHEHEAAAMKRDEADSSSDTHAWESIGPTLDQAIAKLKREDRDALAMRYFQGRSVGEIATALGVSPEAAQKRVWRAVERLRAFFARRGIEATPQGLADLLSANAVASAAPAALVAKIAASATLAGTSSAATVATGKGMVTLMAAAKTKLVVGAATCALLVGVTGTIAYQQMSGPRTRQVQVPPATTPAALAVATLQLVPATVPVLNYMAGLHTAYDLQPGEVVKLVPPPFIPDRLAYYKDFIKDGTNSPNGPDTITFEFDGRTPARFNLSWRRSSYMGGAAPNVGSLLDSVAGIQSYEAVIPNAVLHMPIRGDWVYRTAATTGQRAEALSKILNQHAGLAGSFVQKPVEREVVVMSGTYRFTPLPAAQLVSAPATVSAVHFFRGASPDANHQGTMNVAPVEFVRHIAQMVDAPVINEAKFARRDGVPICDHDSAYLLSPGTPRDIKADDSTLANIAKQTGLQFRREQRVVPTWVWEATSTTKP